MSLRPDDLDQLMQEMRERVDARSGERPAPGPSMTGTFRLVEARLGEQRATERELAAANEPGSDPDAPAPDLVMGFDLPGLPAAQGTQPAAARAAFGELGHDAGAAGIASKPEYALGELLATHDIAFLRNAYAALLGREPDAIGIATFLAPLRSGAISRLEALWRIRHSPEGMDHPVRVRGLGRAYQLERLGRVPLLGYLLQVLRGIAALPHARNRIEALERDNAALRSDVAQRWGQAREHVAGALAALESQVAALTHSATSRYALESMAARLVDTGVAAWKAHAMIREVAGRMAAFRGEIDRLERAKASREDFAADREAVAGELAALEGRATALESTRLAAREFHERVAAIAADLRGLREGLDALETSKVNHQLLGVLAERVEKHSQSLAATIEATRAAIVERLGEVERRVEDAAGGDAAITDEFYLAFEDQFRGTTEDIRQRVEAYLPVVDEAGAGTPERPVLDIGCGRGEWLDVLRDHGKSAKGLDLNQAMVDACIARGLDVAKGDAIEHLRGMPSESLGAISIIHVVEHLPFERLLALIDGCHRVLKPGGLLIMETPNPENVTVGSCNFWFDPTHRAPLPPELLRWTTQARGFATAQVMRLHPVPPEQALRDGDEPVRALLNERFFGPQDYSVIARKAA